MLENKIVLDSDVQILFQGNYSEENVDIAEINSTRVIDNEFESDLIASWENTT